MFTNLKTAKLANMRFWPQNFFSQKKLANIRFWPAFGQYTVGQYTYYPCNSADYHASSSIMSKSHSYSEVYQVCVIGN